jgi:hypothetical protein
MQTRVLSMIKDSINKKEPLDLETILFNILLNQMEDAYSPI